MKVMQKYLTHFLIFIIKHGIFVFFIGIFIFIFGFGISFLFDLLNKKCEKLIFPYDSSLESLESDIKEDNNLLNDSLNIEES